MRITELSTFAKDTLQGLTQSPKKMSSKYFYDERGDALFQDIMAMPEYYLTDCELEVFQDNKAAILAQLPPQFDLIELGAGDGMKTKVLLEHFLLQGVDFQYIPIDISQNALSLLEADLNTNMPNLKVQTLPGDYFEVLEKLSIGKRPKVVLFLGSNIGNFEREEAVRFLSALQEKLNKGDYLFIGIDLKKDPQTIQKAYDDPAGITSAFNLNLLRRMNEELGANFDIQQFKHWETYNPATGDTRSYIVSKAAQKIRLEALNMEVNFDAWEAINMELSKKYSQKEMEALAKDTGFKVAQHFMDKRAYFLDTLWQK